MSITRVAERAGVSPATVSLVINNKPSISPSTARTVRQAMKDIGYVPAPEGRRRGRPMKRETITRLALVSTQPDPWLRSPVYMEVLHGVESATRESNATVLFHCAASISEQDLSLLNGNVDGLLLLGGYSSAQSLGSLSGVPCVQVMGDPQVPGWCDHVTYKGEAIGHLAGTELLRKGHLHTAYISLKRDSHWAIRQHAFESTITAAGGTVKSVTAEEALHTGRHNQTLDQEILGRLLDEILADTPQPTGLFLSADLLASPVYLLLLERGLKPMKDIEIVSCNNDRPFLSGLHPQPVVIDIHAEEVGRQAVARLLWRMQHLDAPVMDLLIQPTLRLPLSTR